MRILVFGAGSVGSLLGGMFARTGHEVWLLGRPWHIDAIEKNGLLITGIWGDYHIKALELARHTEEVQQKNLKFDLILLTVKSFDTQKAISELKPFLSENTTLLSFQNGLGNIETILEVVRPEQFLVGRIITGVEIEPGKVNVTVSADDLVIGELPNTKTVLSAVQVMQMFNNSKIKTRAVPNILTYIWAKVIYNCALNGICALNEIPYGKILEKEETRQDMEKIVHECYEVGLKKGISLDPATSTDYIKLLTQKLIPLTAVHYPSMLQDLKKGKRLEIEALNGAIFRLGQALHVSTPVNQRIAIDVQKKSLAVTNKS